MYNTGVFGGAKGYPACIFPQHYPALRVEQKRKNMNAENIDRTLVTNKSLQTSNRQKLKVRKWHNKQIPFLLTRLPKSVNFGINSIPPKVIYSYGVLMMVELNQS